MPPTVSLRIARPADAAALAELAEQAFRAAFEADNAPGDMDAYVREAFSRARIADELASLEATYWLAESEGRLAGYAKLRTGTAAPGVTGRQPVELHRLYAAPSAIGRGVGSALMQSCLDAARTGGHDVLWLGVWEENARALAFYERWGLATVGHQVFQLGEDAQTDCVTQRRVDA